MPDPTLKMLDYYERRASEYEAIYEKPERQEDLIKLEQVLLDAVKNHNVLEVACGTGFWTRRMALTATSLHATDGSQKLADLATRLCNTENITSGVYDAYQIPASPGINCVVGGFFYSHVPISQQQQFLQNVKNAVSPGAKLILFDNRFVEGSNTPISRTDNEGNNFQLRTLNSGEQEEVIKNFPSKIELVQSFEPTCSAISIVELEYFWISICEFRV